jgi:hypothetical protein
MFQVFACCSDKEYEYQGKTHDTYTDFHFTLCTLQPITTGELLNNHSTTGTTNIDDTNHNHVVNTIETYQYIASLRLIIS